MPKKDKKDRRIFFDITEWRYYPEEFPKEEEENDPELFQDESELKKLMEALGFNSDEGSDKDDGEDDPTGDAYQDSSQPREPPTPGLNDSHASGELTTRLLQD